MATGHTDDLVNNAHAENLLNGIIGYRPCNELASFSFSQEAHFECLHIDKITRPAKVRLLAHFTHRLATTEKECQLRTILDHTSEPVKQQMEIKIFGLACFLQFLKLIE